MILPIGTIVKLLESDKNVMITGYLQQNKATKYTYDYCGCEYPMGITGKDGNLYFDKADITAIVKMGYMDEETKKIQEKIKEYMGTKK